MVGGRWSSSISALALFDRNIVDAAPRRAALSSRLRYIPMVYCHAESGL